MSFGLTEQSTCETREGYPWDPPLKSRESGKFGLLRFADARHVAGDRRKRKEGSERRQIPLSFFPDRARALSKGF